MPRNEQLMPQDKQMTAEISNQSIRQKFYFCLLKTLAGSPLSANGSGCNPRNQSVAERGAKK